MATKLSNEEFLNRVYKLNLNIEPLEPYKNRRTHILCRCKVCGHIWSPTPAHLFKGTGCPNCAKEKLFLTHTEVVKHVQELNPNVELLDNYVSKRTRIRFKCKICDNVWETTPASIYAGGGCPVCANNKRALPRKITKDQFLCRLKEKHPSIILDDNYIDFHTKVKFKCIICGNSFDASPHEILYRLGCEYCTGNKISNDTFKQRLKQFNNTIEPLTEYTKINALVSCRCSICGYEWDAYPYNLYTGSGCPSCGNSKGENRIKQFLIEHSIRFYTQYRFSNCKNKATLPFDFYLPDFNICIEYDGQQHFEPVTFGGRSYEDSVKALNYVQKCDSIKNTYCKTQGIKLIRIKFNQFDEINNILAQYFL